VNADYDPVPRMYWLGGAGRAGRSESCQSRQQQQNQ